MDAVKDFHITDGCNYTVLKAALGKNTYFPAPCIRFDVNTFT